MTNVKVVQQTNKPQTNQQTVRAKTICPRYHYRGHKKDNVLFYKFDCIQYTYIMPCSSNYVKTVFLLHSEFLGCTTTAVSYLTGNEHTCQTEISTLALSSLRPVDAKAWKFAFMTPYFVSILCRLYHLWHTAKIHSNTVASVKYLFNNNFYGWYILR